MSTPGWGLGTGRRSWHFLLPDTGAHTLRVEGLGTSEQKVRIDDVPVTYAPTPGLPSGSGFTLTGPDESQLELQCLDPKTRHWVLFVNGLRLEEMVEAPHKPFLSLGSKLSQESLRGTKKLPDGSYTIAAQFDAENLSYRLNVIRKFRFYTGATRHEVGISHTLPGIWQLTMNGRLSERTSHATADTHGFLEFDVPLENQMTPSSGSRGGEIVRGRMEMDYDNWKMIWSYRVWVNKVEVPCSWTKAKGELAGVTAPQVLSDDFMAANGIAWNPEVGGHEGALEPVHEYDFPEGPPAQYYATTASTEPDGQELGSTEPDGQEYHSRGHSRLLGSLPQGVSFDAETGCYQANIKSRAGKFVFLGEFTSMDEAHQKYLEALPIHSPEKQVYASAGVSGA